MAASQLWLLGRETPSIDPTFSALRRSWLDSESWIDFQPAWLQGHAALLESLQSGTAWHQGSQQMWEHVYDTPRLTASLPDDGLGHPVLEVIRRALSRRYQCRLGSPTLACYRDGEDSVAFHGDKLLRDQQTALVCIVSIGEPRRFHLRPKEGGDSISFRAGLGDLTVMGGACQRRWEHGIPKCDDALGPRIAIMFRREGHRFELHQGSAAAKPAIRWV